MIANRYIPPDFKHKVAIVSGASRGIGRGIAKVLGQSGCKVYVTGRTKPGEKREHLGGNIQETVELINSAGGNGIPVYCDHTEITEVKKLFTKIRKENTNLDLLVNNVWGGYEGHDETFVAPFWKQPITRWDGMFQSGVFATFLTCKFAAPLFVRQNRGLIVNISAGDNGKFLHQTMYDTAKTAIDRLAFGIALELRKYNVTALSIHPGFTRTERVMEALKKEKNFDFSPTNSVEYVGRAIVSLLEDPQVMEKSGDTYAVGDLAEEYDFTDIDGRQIEAFHIPDFEG